jgi:hypothetical protein
MALKRVVRRVAVERASRAPLARFLVVHGETFDRRRERSPSFGRE